MFESANPSVVKSIKQRDHLNTWLRLYAREQIGARLAPFVMPVYHECVRRALPVYTIAHIDDIHRRVVAYERLVLPFSDGGAVTHAITSLKTISEDGGFEIKNLMRGHDTLPRPIVRAVIERDLFHRAPGRIPCGDVIGFV